MACLTGQNICAQNRSRLPRFWIFDYTITMIRLTNDTPVEVLVNIKKGDLVTDTFSKTGLVDQINITDDGLYQIFEFILVTGRVITVKR